MKRADGAILRQVIAPGGSLWQCEESGRTIEPGRAVVKLGKRIFCDADCFTLWRRTHNQDGTPRIDKSSTRV